MDIEIKQVRMDGSSSSENAVYKKYEIGYRIKPINETGVACPLLTPPVYTIHPLCIIFPPPISHTISYGNLVLLASSTVINAIFQNDN